MLLCHSTEIRKLRIWASVTSVTPKRKETRPSAYSHFSDQKCTKLTAKKLAALLGLKTEQLMIPAGEFCNIHLDFSKSLK